MEPVPLAVLAASLLRWDRILLALFLKWWTLWFTLGRDFSRTSVLCLGAVLSSSLAIWLALHSGAVGPAGGDHHHSLWAAALLLWLLQGSFEAWLLRQGMRRMVLRSWNWRRYDLLSFCFCQTLIVAYVWWRVA